MFLLLLQIIGGLAALLSIVYYTMAIFGRIAARKRRKNGGASR